MKQPAVYILTSQNHKVLYIGVTSDLVKRIWQHKENQVEGFTSKYNVHKLVYYEQHASMNAAILREKQLKKWKRSWKNRIIEEINPKWNDLYWQII